MSGKSGGCAVPDTSGLKDLHAERMILAGILREGRALADELSRMHLKVGDFYSDVHQKAFNLFMYTAYGFDPPLLLEAFNECVQTRSKSGYLGGSFATSGEFATWMADVYYECLWLADEPGSGGWRKGMYFWADPEERGSRIAWAALAAAAKVRYLAGRRSAYYLAVEALREATDPCGSADDLWDGIQGD